VWYNTPVKAKFSIALVLTTIMLVAGCLQTLPAQPSPYTNYDRDFLEKVLYPTVKVFVNDVHHGTGVCLDSRTILTVAHLFPEEVRDGNGVITNPVKTIHVLTYGGSVVTGLEIYRLSRVMDLAVLRLPEPTFNHFVRIGSPPRLLQELVAVGHPARHSDLPHFVRGRVTILRYQTGDGVQGDLFVFSAPIAFGFSGGGIFDDTTHELVGLNHAILKSGYWPYWNYAIGINIAAIGRFLR